MEFRRAIEFRPPPLQDQAQAIWLNTIDDQAEGILSEFLSIEDLDTRFGYGLWLATVRFAVWQKLKYRMIDDASKGHNQTFASSETIHTTSAAACAALTRQFRTALGRPICRRTALLVGSRDMKKAYKQIPVHESQLKYMVIAVFDPPPCVNGVSLFPGPFLLVCRGRSSL